MILNKKTKTGRALRKRWKFWSFKRKQMASRARRQRRRFWKRMEPYALWTIVLVGVLVIGGLFAREQMSALRDPAPKTSGLAEVNGESVSFQEYQNAIDSQAGQAVLDQLILQKVIAQKAKERGIEVPLKDVVLPEEFKDSPNRNLLAKELQTSMLLRKLILEEIQESEVREVYQTFKEELTQYDIAALAVGTDTEKITTGLSLRQLESLFGTDTTYTVISLKEGAKTPPIAVGNSTIVVRLVASRSDFESLKKSAEDILVNAKRADYVFELVEKAEIDSPFLPETVSPKASPAAPRK